MENSTIENSIAELENAANLFMVVFTLFLLFLGYDIRNVFFSFK